jgi:hypothetical protein
MCYEYLTYAWILRWANRKGRCGAWPHADLCGASGRPQVVVSGDAALPTAPAWGAGGFVVAQFGSLSLANLVVSGPIRVDPGGARSISSEI